MSLLNFSTPLKCSGIAKYSPNGELICFAKGSHIYILNISTYKQIAHYSFIDIVDSIEWSYDSTKILIGIYSRDICEVKCLNNSSFNFRIDEGLFGMKYARFVPNNQSILTSNHFNMRMIIWSLANKSSMFINNPKYSHKGLEFSPNGILMALAEIKGGDHIGIYNTNDWSIINSFQVATSDLQDLKWINENDCVIVWDTFTECKFIIYAVITGNALSLIEPYQFDLGIRQLNISPNGQFITIGCFDQTVKIYNCLNECELIDIFEHGEFHIDEKVTYLQETVYYIDDIKKIKFTKQEPPIKIESTDFINCLETQTLPKKGIKSLEWSQDSIYLASKNENMPKVLWIWKIAALSLHAVLIFNTDIISFRWSPHNLNLAITCDSPYIYFYDVSHISLYNLPTPILSIDTIIWSDYDKNSLALTNISEIVICEMKGNTSKSFSTVY